MCRAQPKGYGEMDRLISVGIDSVSTAYWQRINSVLTAYQQRIDSISVVKGVWNTVYISLNTSTTGLKA